MWLNPVFRFRNNPIRIFKRRFTVLEVVWAIISAAFTAIVLFLLSLIFGSVGPFFMLFSPIAIIVWSTLALILGRRIAFLSPLRRQTGEGTGTWVVIMFKRIITRVSFMFSRPVMYNYCTSRAGDARMRNQRVECIEWLGTAHSPRSPIIEKNETSDFKPVELVPRGVSVYHREETSWPIL